MKLSHLLGLSACGLMLAASTVLAQAPYQHVLIISIDGMHSLDLANCSKGVATINSGKPYCPTLALLAKHGINYLQTYTSRPSDSYPGLAAIARRAFITMSVMTASIRRPIRLPRTASLAAPLCALA
jgi:hypothetical protein